MYGVWPAEFEGYVWKRGSGLSLAGGRGDGLGYGEGGRHGARWDVD